MKECEFCGNRVKQDDHGRYVCTVCNAESQSASVTVAEFEEALASTTYATNKKTKRSVLRKREEETERDYFICYQQALKIQAMYLVS